MLVNRERSCLMEKRVQRREDRKEAQCCATRTQINLEKRANAYLAFVVVTCFTFQLEELEKETL